MIICHVYSHLFSILLYQMELDKAFAVNIKYLNVFSWKDCMCRWTSEDCDLMTANRIKKEVTKNMLITSDMQMTSLNHNMEIKTQIKICFWFFVKIFCIDDDVQEKLTRHQKWILPEQITVCGTMAKWLSPKDQQTGSYTLWTMTIPSVMKSGKLSLHLSLKKVSTQTSCPTSNNPEAF